MYLRGTTLLAVFALAASCSGGAGTVGDAGIPLSTLEILSPADSVGIAFGQRATLTVRYLGTGGAPSAGVRIAFAIVGFRTVNAIS